MLLYNRYDRDAEDAKYIQECMAQRARLNITVKEEDVLTVDELEMILDYEAWMEDVDFIRHGGA